MTWMMRTWVGLLGWALLAGCVLFPSDHPVVHTFRLSLDEAKWHAENQRGEQDGRGTLLVTTPLALSGFDTPRMAYRQRPFEVNYYATSQWADTPAHMLAPLLALALDRSGVWNAVILGRGPVGPDYRLDTKDLLLEQQFLQRPSRVYLGARMQLYDLKAARVVGTRTFELFEETESEDAYGGVTAANRAVAKLVQDASVWIKECVTTQTQAGC